MPFADRVLRRGHLSEDALATAVATGERPAHLDHCATCSARALELSRWLDDLRGDALSAADAVFTAERLSLQHASILKRIEQVESPVRVLEFPTGPVAARSTGAVRLVPAAWLGVAAAAGLALGVLGTHISGRIVTPQATADATAAVPAPPAPAATPLFDYDLDLEGAVPATLRDMDSNTPHLLPTQMASNR